MATTLTTPYDIADHLRTREEMAAYLEACLAEAHGDAAFIAKALGDIARAKRHEPSGQGCRAFTRKPLQSAVG